MDLSKIQKKRRGGGKDGKEGGKGKGKDRKTSPDRPLLLEKSAKSSPGETRAEKSLGFGIHKLINYHWEGNHSAILERNFENDDDDDNDNRVSAAFRQGKR